MLLYSFRFLFQWTMLPASIRGDSHLWSPSQVHPLLGWFALKSPAFAMDPVASGICPCFHLRVSSSMSADLIITTLVSATTIWAEYGPHPLRYSHCFVGSSSASSLASSRVSSLSSSLFSSHVAGSFGFLKPKFCQLVLASLPPLSPAPTPAPQPVFTKSSLPDHPPLLWVQMLDQLWVPFSSLPAHCLLR